jgi:hypothetical protein
MKKRKKIVLKSNYKYKLLLDLLYFISKKLLIKFYEFLLLSKSLYYYCKSLLRFVPSGSFCNPNIFYVIFFLLVFKSFSDFLLVSFICHYFLSLLVFFFCFLLLLLLCLI